MESTTITRTRHIREGSMTRFVDEPTTQLPRLANSPEIEAAHLILRAVEKKLDLEQEIVDNTPKRDERRIKDDLYFKMGMIHMCNWILSVPQNARQWCQEALEIKDE